MKKPDTLIISDKWAQSPCVVFEDEELIGNIIPTEWVNDKIDGIRDENEFDDDFKMPIRERIENEMIDDFYDDNVSVDEFWPDLHMLRYENYYYRYDEDGNATYIGEFDSIDEAQL